MPSPIFASLLIRKYILQTRYNISQPWQDYETYRHLEQAEHAFKKFIHQKPTSQARIFNRLTGRVLQSYPTRK